MLNDVDLIVGSKFKKHPFSGLDSDTDYENLLANYMAMSQAFPYLQAGSQKDIFNHYMKNNQEIPEHVEITTVVGNFLCWDETGGLITIKQGLKALPKILDTRRFHVNLLKNDCKKILGKPIQAHYSSITKNYLDELYLGLSSLDPIVRVACMVAFEAHANQMIDSLWQALCNNFSLEPKSLSYFLLHVGGDDPAEAYHVQTTQKMIDKIVAPEDKNIFFKKFEYFYEKNILWCKDISMITIDIN